LLTKNSSAKAGIAEDKRIEAQQPVSSFETKLKANG
jgi:hypothetical protein